MVTNNTYKSYSRQIAKLFCSEQQNKVLCEATIAERLNNFLDDYTYPVFLSKLNSGRMYITNLEAFQNKGFRVVITDLITGEYATAWWTIPYNLPYYGQLANILNSHKFNIISANKTFNEANRSDIRITWNATKPNYEITFVPYTPPGVTPGSGTPGITPGSGTPGQIIPTPSQPQLTPGSPGAEPGIDLQGFLDLLTNPIVIIVGGVAIYYLMKK